MEYSFRVIKFGVGRYSTYKPMVVSSDHTWNVTADSKKEALGKFRDDNFPYIQGKYGDPAGIDNLIEIIDASTGYVIDRDLVKCRRLVVPKEWKPNSYRIKESYEFEDPGLVTSFQAEVKDETAEGQSIYLPRDLGTEAVFRDKALLIDLISRKHQDLILY